MSLSLRTIKLIFATVLAIYLATVLGLSYTTAAGIIAILSVLDTRKSSFKMARNRLFSTLLALTIAVLTFALFGFWHLDPGHLPSTLRPSGLPFQLGGWHRPIDRPRHPSLARARYFADFFGK